MKLTIFLVGLLAVASCRGEDEPKEESAESKEKREAPVAHYTSSAGPHTSHMLQIPSQGHGGSNAISIGAGYSIGGGKHGGYSGGGGPSSASYSGGGGKQGGYSGGASSAGYSGGASSVGYSGGGGGKHGGFSGAYASAGPASYKIQSVKPQFQLPGGQTFSSLEDLMHSLRSSGLNVGEPTHGASAAPAAIYGSPHGGGSGGALASIGGHQFALPQATYGGPKLALSLGSGGHGPSYAVGVQGLGAYASGSHGSLGATGPQLFNPAPAQGYSASHAYAAPAAIAVAHAPAVSYGAPSSGHSFGDSVQSFGGQSLGGSGHSYGGAGHSFGGAGLSFGSPGHSFGGLSSSKGFGDLYGGSSGSSFKPSAFLGASLQDSHGEAFSGSVGHGGGLSAESLSAFGGHGSSGFGSGKYSGQSYLAPSEGFGSSFGGGHSFGSLQGAFSGSGHSSSPPGTSYGVPSGSYGLPGNAHVSSSNNYYKYSPVSYSGPSFGQGSSAYSHGGGSLSSLGSSPYQQAQSSSYGAPDSDGEHSQTAYNTIKYSSELNPKKKM